MTVKELKEALNKFDDRLIVLAGNAEGYIEVINVSQGVNELDGLLFLDDYVEEE